MEYKFIRRKEDITILALNALGSRRVVTARYEQTHTAPGTFVIHLKGKIFGQTWWTVVAEETLTQPLRLSPGNHSTASRSNWHCTGSPQQLQLNRSTLDTGYAKGHTSIVDFIVAKFFQENIRNLSQTQSLKTLNVEGYNGDPVQ